MCGQIGFSGYKGQEFDINKVKILLLFNQERGKDATGIWTPLSGLVKTIQESEDYISSQNSIGKIIEDITLMGHCRQGTIGKNNPANAHPFQYDNIVFQHNGSLTNHNAIAREYNLQFNDWDVDSQVIAQILNKEQKPHVFTEIEGSFACIWTDTSRKATKLKQDDSLLYILRNEERPLYYGITSEGMYMSSIEKSLKAINCEDIKEFDPGIIYSIINGEIKKQTPIELKKKIVQNYNNNTYSNDLDTYLGRWILADTKACGKNNFGKYDTIRDKWYYCRGAFNPNVSHSSSAVLEVIDIEDNSTHAAPKHNFYFSTTKDYKLKLGIQVVFMEEITKKKDNTHIVFRKGDIACIDGEVEGGNTFLITDHSSPNKMKYRIKKSWIRPLQRTESNFKVNIYEDTELYKNSIKETTKPTIINPIKEVNSNSSNTSNFPSNLSSNTSNCSSDNNSCNNDRNESELEESDVIVPDSQEDIDSLVLNHLLESGELTRDEVLDIVTNKGYSEDIIILKDMETRCNNILEPLSDIEEVFELNETHLDELEKNTVKKSIDAITKEVAGFYKEVYNLS
jgi:predicted glutamine amidotransferase